MSTISNPRTLAALRELGCLDDEKVSTKALAALLAQRLESGHIAASLDDIAAVETTIGQLATGLVGEEDPEFVEVIRPLLSPQATGRVQRALSNGYMLCGGRVQIDISIEGETKRTSVGTRFLSADHAVIEQYVLAPRLKRVERLAESSVALRELVGSRQPSMAEQLGAFTERLNVTWQRALNPGSSS
jgi:hypothetical protein